MQPSSKNGSQPSPIEAYSPEQSLADSSKRVSPGLLAVAFSMESLDTTILNTGVPTIAAALHVAPLSMKSVLASYTLSLAVFIPISGWMADRFGTRRVFASAIGIFTLGSFLCGISSDIHLLVACRILQGCGGSMMVPVGRLTLVRTFAKSELVRAMSFVAIPSLIGPMLGPIAGGLIVGYLHWRLIFFVNIPIGLVGLFLVYWHLPDYREHTNPLDVTGLILFGSRSRISSLEANFLRQYSDWPRWFVPGLLAPAGLPRAPQSPGCTRPDSLRIRCRAAFVRAGGVWRTYAERARNSRAPSHFDPPLSGLRVSRDTQPISHATSHPVSHSHISCGCGW